MINVRHGNRRHSEIDPVKSNRQEGVARKFTSAGKKDEDGGGEEIETESRLVAVVRA